MFTVEIQKKCQQCSQWGNNTLNSYLAMYYMVRTQFVLPLEQCRHLDEACNRNKEQQTLGLYRAMF